jgi:mRNA interferase MazF
LPAYLSGLPQDSVANVTQMLTVDKTLLTDFVGNLPDSLLQQIEVGLKLVLNLH